MKCPVCEIKIKEDEFLRTYTLDFNNQEYKLYHCPKYGLQFWYPLKIVPGFYEDKTDIACFGRHSGLQEDLTFNQKNFFKHFPLKTGKLLDIGCGDGLFLREAQKLGFEVYGTDFNEGRIKAAKEKFNIQNVYAMGLDKFVNFAKERHLTFDVITFFDVLEHQDDPEGFLEMTKELLKPGGWVAGGVPHRDRLWVDRERKLNPSGDAPPHHFLWLSKDSLTNLFSSNGFDTRNYSVPVDLLFFASYLESLIFKTFGQNVKKFFKRIILGKDKENLSLDIIKKIEEKQGMRLRVALFLRRLRNYIFSPLALILIKLYNKRGAMIYFQGTLKE